MPGFSGLASDAPGFFSVSRGAGKPPVDAPHYSRCDVISRSFPLSGAFAIPTLNLGERSPWKLRQGHCPACWCGLCSCLQTASPSPTSPGKICPCRNSIEPQQAHCCIFFALDRGTAPQVRTRCLMHRHDLDRARPGGRNSGGLSTASQDFRS